MKILDRYISRRFLGVLLFSLVAFISIFIIVDLVEKLDAFIDQDVPKFIILKYYIFSLPYIIVLTLPVAMLLSSLFSIGNMARQNEIVAMKSAGISLYRILAPLFIIAFLISAGALVFGEYVLPKATEEKEYLNDEYLEKHRQRWRKRINNVYARDAQNRIISMRYYDTVRDIGHTVSIRSFDGKEIKSRIDARKIVWEDSVWVLYEGYQRTFNGDRETAKPFTSLVLRDENLRPDDFGKLLKKPEEMSYGELKAFIEEVKRNGSDPDRWLVDLYLKLSIPFANFIIVLFGAPLASVKRRGGAATGFGISLAIVFIYFGIVKTAQTMGHTGLLPPLLSAWIANAIFGIAGIVVLLKTKK